jgi:uncharacterized OB-fold protein
VGSTPQNTECKTCGADNLPGSIYCNACGEKQ